jgi:hypothetical protein
MSTQSNGTALNFADNNSTASDMGPNSFNFSTGLGNPDANTGLDSLNAGLTGPNAGTLPNGFLNGAGGNYTPSPSLSGISSGSLNGNVSFGMPGSSVDQLNSQALNANNVANAQGALAAGAKVANTAGNSNQRLPTGSGKITMKPVQFSAPIADFAGSAGGSQVGSSLLQLLSKYRPGVAE